MSTWLPRAKKDGSYVFFVAQGIVTIALVSIDPKFVRFLSYGNEMSVDLFAELNRYEFGIGTGKQKVRYYRSTEEK